LTMLLCMAARAAVDFLLLLCNVRLTAGDIAANLWCYVFGHGRGNITTGGHVLRAQMLNKNASRCA